MKLSQPQKGNGFLEFPLNVALHSETEDLKQWDSDLDLDFFRVGIYIMPGPSLGKRMQN